MCSSTGERGGGGGGGGVAHGCASHPDHPSASRMGYGCYNSAVCESARREPLRDKENGWVPGAEREEANGHPLLMNLSI